MGGNGAKGNGYGGVNGDVLLYQGFNDFVDKGDRLGRKHGGWDQGIWSIGFQRHSWESSMNLVHPVTYGEDRVGICGSPTGGIAAWIYCRSDWVNPTQWLSYSRGTRPNQ